MLSRRQTYSSLIIIFLVLLISQPVFSAQKKSSGPEAMYRKGNELYDMIVLGKVKGTPYNWDRVILYSRQFIETYPHDYRVPEAQYQIGRCYMWKQEYGRAQEAFEILLSKYPKSGLAGDALYLIAYMYQHQGKLVEAAKTYLEVVEKYPNSNSAQRVLRKAPSFSVASANSKEAKAIYNKIISLGKTARDSTASKENSGVVSDSTKTKQSVEPESGLAEKSITVTPKSTSQNPEWWEKVRKYNYGYISNITVWSSGKSTRIVIKLEKSSEYESKLLSNPSRLVIDIENTVLHPPKQELSVKDGVVEKVRASQYSETVSRVVVDIEKMKAYNIFKLSDPQRIVIDAIRPVKEKVKVSPKHKQSKTEEKEPIGEPSLAQQLGLKVKTVVIDPGHGGSDTGAIGPNDLQEKDVVLDIGLELKKILEKDPTYDVYLTREEDLFVPLDQRTAFANQKGADLFLSIHLNSARSSNRGSGIETYYLSLASDKEAMLTAAFENATASRRVKDLEGTVRSILKYTKLEESREFSKIVQEKLVTKLQRDDRGIKRAPFVVLIGANMPSVLTEVSFLNQPEEAELLATKEYRFKIAESLADAINFYATGHTTVARK